MNRRGFLKSILAAGVAPYVVTTAGVLMPVRKVVAPQLYYGGLHNGGAPMTATEVLARRAAYPKYPQELVETAPGTYQVWMHEFTAYGRAGIVYARDGSVRLATAEELEFATRLPLA